MPNFFDRALFRTPGFSIHEQNENRKQTIPIGRIIPCYFNDIYAGDEIDINLSQITKFSAVLAPIFHRFELDFIAGFVPFRLLADNGWWNSEDFFNDATADSDRPAVPKVSVYDIYSGIEKIVGSVWDYLRYPRMLWILENLQNDRYRIANVNTQIYYSDLFDLSSTYAGQYNVTLGDNAIASISRLNSWYISRYSSVDWSSYSDGTTIIDQSAFWKVLYAASGLKQDQAIQKYINYLHLTCVIAYMNGNAQFKNARVNLLPFLCYRQFCNDWFKNTNIQDVDSDIDAVTTYIIEQVSQLNRQSFDEWFQDGNPVIGNMFDSDSEVYTGDCDASLWQSDYFTSAFENPQAGSSSVPIPVNGTIPDLSVARRLQWALTKTMYAGKRLIDQIFVHRGVKSSDARMHRTEIIGYKKYNLRVDDVLQTSQSDLESSLADYAGYVSSVTGDHLCHYRAEEAGLVMVMCRVRPRLEYMDTTPRFILKSDYYDFENPDYDNVGMQPIWRNEISFDSSLPTVTFGWQRKYAEYMTGIDSVCGDMATNMDYWHAARKFLNTPVLNEKFITMRPDKDDYNRIFAVPGNDRPVIQYLHFDVKCSRPLSRYVQFDY